jgi:hypothetical protein
MFQEALGYPTRPPRGGRAVLVGGTLLFVVGTFAAGGSVAGASLEPLLAPVALLGVPPWLLLRGYYVRVLRGTVGREHPTPPGFGGVRRLLRDGVAAAAIAAGYLLPGVAVLAPFVYARTRGADLVTLLLGDGVPPGVAAGLTGAAGMVALFAVFALIAALYALPVAVVNYAATDRLRAAFDVRTVASGAATEDYVVTWGVSLLLQVLVLPVAYLLKPILVGFFVHFLVAVAVRYCYGQGAGAALDLPPLEPAREGPTDEPTPGATTSAVRPIEETDVPALRASGSTSRSDGAGRRVGERPEGERT